MSTYEIVRDCAALILAGLVLHASDVTAGNGKVIDWRDVKCGKTVQEESNAFDVANFFVMMVGVEAARGAVVERTGEDAPGPEVTAFQRQPNGGRLRAFVFGGFRVMVEAHEDDERQAAFVERLAALCASEA
jgi:hypothetical protein